MAIIRPDHTTLHKGTQIKPVEQCIINILDFKTPYKDGCEIDKDFVLVDAEYTVDDILIVQQHNNGGYLVTNKGQDQILLYRDIHDRFEIIKG